MGEKLCQLYIWYRISKYIQTTFRKVKEASDTNKWARHLTRISKEDIKMGKKYLKTDKTSNWQTKKPDHSLVLGIMEMWNPNNFETSSDISKEWQKSTNWSTTKDGQDVENGTIFLYCWWAYKLVQPLWKSVWINLKKLKINLTYNSGFCANAQR